MDFTDVVQALCRRERIAFRSHCVVIEFLLRQFSPRPFHVSAMTMVRSCHVVEDSITLLTRSFGSLHVCCTFAAGSHHVYVTVSVFSINCGPNSSHHGLCFNYDLNMNLELLLQLVLLQWHQALFDAKAALVLVRRRRNRKQPLHMLTYENVQSEWDRRVRGVAFIGSGKTQWERGKCVISAGCDLNGRSKNVVRNTGHGARVVRN